MKIYGNLLIQNGIRCQIRWRSNETVSISFALISIELYISKVYTLEHLCSS